MYVARAAGRVARHGRESQASTGRTSTLTAMSTTSPEQNAEHLRLLSIFHYVLAGVTALASLLPIFHLILGIGILTGAIDSSESEGAEGLRWMGGVFAAFAAVLILFGMGLAYCMFRAGRAIVQRRSRTFCMIVACVMCLWFPLGTVLGVFTIVVLSRDSVRAEFEAAS